MTSPACLRVARQCASPAPNAKHPLRWPSRPLSPFRPLTPKKSFSWYVAHATSAHTAALCHGRSASRSISSRAREPGGAEGGGEARPYCAPTGDGDEGAAASAREAGGGTVRRTARRSGGRDARRRGAGRARGGMDVGRIVVACIVFRSQRRRPNEKTRRACVHTNSACTLLIKGPRERPPLTAAGEAKQQKTLCGRTRRARLVRRFRESRRFFFFFFVRPPAFPPSHHDAGVGGARSLARQCGACVCCVCVWSRKKTTPRRAPTNRPSLLPSPSRPPPRAPPGHSPHQSPPRHTRV